MTRRFQFSLKTMMVATTVACAALGGWHLFSKYGQFVQAEKDKDGQPIRIRGRIIHAFGPKELCYYFRAIDVSKERGSYESSKSAFLDRSWLCVYRLNVDYRLPTADYSLELSEHDLFGWKTDVSDKTVIHGEIRRH